MNTVTNENLPIATEIKQVNNNNTVCHNSVRVVPVIAIPYNETINQSQLNNEGSTIHIPHLDLSILEHRQRQIRHNINTLHNNGGDDLFIDTPHAIDIIRDIIENEEHVRNEDYTCKQLILTLKVTCCILVSMSILFVIFTSPP